MISNPAKLEELEVPKNLGDDFVIFETWQKLAKKMIHILWKLPQSWIFQEPVDPVKLEIPDYFDIIKKPMDFETIRLRLLAEEYACLRDFLDDVELTFENCITYNGDSSVGKLGSLVREEYRKLCKQLNTDFYIQQGQEI